MISEIIFVIHASFISICALISLALGKHALVTFVCVQCLLANFFVIKQTTLFGFNVTCADAYTVGAVIGLNLLQEYFGKEITKKTIFINFFILVFYTIISQIHLLYTPSEYDTAHQYFAPLLQFMPRIMVASISVYLFAQLLDYALYGFLKQTLNNKHLVLRNYTSIALCQFIDTILFSFLGLYGIVHNIWDVIIVSYSVKLLAIVLATPFVGLSKYVYTKN